MFLGFTGIALGAEAYSTQCAGSSPQLQRFTRLEGTTTTYHRKHGKE